MKNEIIVKKIIAYTDKLLDYCDGLTSQQFFADTKLVEACVFNLSQIGELAKRIDDEFAKKHDNIPWRSIYNLRNRIVHDYEGVNLSLIWEIIDGDLAQLRKELLALTDDMNLN